MAQFGKIDESSAGGNAVAQDESEIAYALRRVDFRFVAHPGLQFESGKRNARTGWETPLLYGVDATVHGIDAARETKSGQQHRKKSHACLDVAGGEFGTIVLMRSVSLGLGPITTRLADTRDYAAIARIQALAPEAAQWPVGDYSNYPVLLALLDETIVGFCAFRQSVPDEGEVLNIAVDPEYRRRGVGKALLNKLRLRVQGEIFLEVADNNTPALGLYAGLGYGAISIRPGYYAHGKISGIVMKKTS